MGSARACNGVFGGSIVPHVSSLFSSAVVLRAQLTTAVAYLTAAREEAAASADDTMQHINAALEVLTACQSRLELFPSVWKGLKAVPKGKGKGKDKDGKGKGELPFTPGLGPAPRYDSPEWHAEQERRYAAMQRKADGKGSSSSAARSRSRSPVWQPVAGGHRMPVTPPDEYVEGCKLSFYFTFFLG